MREFTIPFGRQISRGLRPDDRMPRNSMYLTKCQNIRPIRVGGLPTLSTFTPIGYPTGIQDVSVSHPHPQIFKGREVTLLADATTLYSIDEAEQTAPTETWRETQITTYDSANTSNTKAITNTDSKSWHFADFGDVYALFNGTSIVFKMAKEAMTGGIDKVLVNNSITINTGCASMGRMIMGGFDSTNFLTSAWDSFLQTWQARDFSDVDFNFADAEAPGSNFVWWSEIGGDAFFLIYLDSVTTGWIQDQEDETYGFTGTTYETRLNEMIERNEFGFMPMNWQGTVQRVLGLGNGHMVYGDNGISYMPTHENTYGLKDILFHGIYKKVVNI